MPFTACVVASSKCTQTGHDLGERSNFYVSLLMEVCEGLVVRAGLELGSVIHFLRIPCMYPIQSVCVWVHVVRICS